MVSEKYTMKGYSFKEWARLNKDNFKAVVVFLTGYSYLIGFDWKTFAVAGAAVLSKFVLDGIDYWLKE